MACASIHRFNLAPRETTARPADANDFKQFAELRRSAGANDPAALREVARQFESLFTKMMLEGMRSASFGDPMFGSDQVDMYQDMMDDQLAVQMSQGKGLGLADMLIRQLSQGAMAPVRGLSKVRTTNKSIATSSARSSSTKFSRMRPPPRASSASTRAASWRRPRSKPAGAPRSRPMRPDRVTTCSASRPATSWRGASVAADTQEFTAGVAGRETARFRAYGNIAESVADYVSVLRDNPRYAAALNTGSRRARLRDGVAAGWLRHRSRVREQAGGGGRPVAARGCESVQVGRRGADTDAGADKQWLT